MYTQKHVPVETYLYITAVQIRMEISELSTMVEI